MYLCLEILNKYRLDFICNENKIVRLLNFTQI